MIKTIVKIRQFKCRCY